MTELIRKRSWQDELLANENKLRELSQEKCRGDKSQHGRDMKEDYESSTDRTAYVTERAVQGKGGTQQVDGILIGR